jgi:undecaprenyl-diphosphatase
LFLSGIAFVVFRSTENRAIRIVTVALAVITSLTTGFARIWVGAHWPSDVVGGYLVGIIIFSLSVLILHFLELRRTQSGVAELMPAGPLQ